MENIIHKRSYKGYAIEAIEENNVVLFQELVPARVGPDDLSDGACGQRRTIRAIAEYWAGLTSQYEIINYIRGLDPGAGAEPKN